jgi:DNA-binding CsgD family transcriptional regulator
MHLRQGVLVVEQCRGQLSLQVLGHGRTRDEHVRHHNRRHGSALAVVRVGRDLAGGVELTMGLGEPGGGVSGWYDHHLAAGGVLGQGARRQASGPEAGVDRSVSQRGNGVIDPELLAVDVRVGIDPADLQDAQGNDLRAGSWRPERYPLPAQAIDVADAGLGARHELGVVIVEAPQGACLHRRAIERLATFDRVRGRVGQGERDVGRAGRDQLHVVDRRVRLLGRGTVARNGIADDRCQASAQNVVDAARSPSGDRQSPAGSAARRATGAAGCATGRTAAGGTGRGRAASCVERRTAAHQQQAGNEADHDMMSSLGDVGGLCHSRSSCSAVTPLQAPVLVAQDLTHKCIVGRQPSRRPFAWAGRSRRQAVGSASLEGALPQVLFERDGDLGQLVDLIDRLVERGEGGVAVIEGPPGLGKTRLLEIAAEHAAGRGARVLQARGSELEFELVFGGVRQLLVPAVAVSDPATRAHVLRGPAALAADIVGEPHRDRGDPGEPMYALAALISNLAEEQPLVLAVDDDHWLDDASGRFLTYLARRVEGQRVLLLTARRPIQPGADEPARELASHARIISPEPLSIDGVGRVLESVFGTAVPRDLAVACARVAGGNPFLVVEAARALSEVPEKRRVEMADAIAPRSIGAAVLGRIHRLPAPAAHLAGVIALFPNGTTLADAAAVAGIPQRAAADAADALVGAHVLARGSSLAFDHPVVRAAVYEQLGRFARGQGHARAAEVLLERDADIEEIAAHLLAGEPSGNAEFVAVLVAAADRAERSGAVSAAARYLARALEEPPPKPDRLALSHRLGRALAAVGAPDAIEVLRHTFDRSADDERVQIGIDLAAASFAAGRFDEAVTTLLSIRTAAREDREQRLTVEALLSHFAWESEHHGSLYAEVADALPRDLPGDTPGERLALAQVGARMFDRSEPHEQTGAVLWRALSPESGTLVVWSVELGDTLNLLIHCGRIDDAEAYLRRRQDDARASGRDALYISSLPGLTMAEWVRGDLSACEASLRLAMELPGGHATDRGLFAGGLANVCVIKGAYDEAGRLLDLVVATGGVGPSLMWRRGELELALGRPADAVAYFERGHEDLLRRGSLNPAESPWLTDFAEALALTNRRPDAMELLADYMDRAEAFGEARALGNGYLALGRLAGGDRRMEHLERAVAILEPSPYRLGAARARLELGAALRRANRRADSRDHLRQALDYAHRHGLEPLAARAREELIAGGARPRRRALVGVDALTPSERRIGGMAASGLTNREIANHLFLTVKTVEMHMSRTFDKLGTASRRELAHFLGSESPVAS